MTVYDLLYHVNPSTLITFFNEKTGESMETFDGTEDISDEYDDYEVTDIFVENGIISCTPMLCIEVCVEE